MKNSKILIMTFLLLLGFIAAYFFLFKTEEKEDHSAEEDHGTHFHAAFVVITETQTMNFADFKYMHNKPCTEDATTEVTIKDKVHLHDMIGDVVHVHDLGITWGVFLNGSMELNLSANTYGYIDGVKVENIFDTEMTKDSRVLIVDSNTEVNLEDEYEKVPSVERIEEVESLSEGCGI